MRIEYLKFKNINSLKGEWHIDFLSDEFLESGIFAIVGETGAGKHINIRCNYPRPIWKDPSSKGYDLIKK